VFKRPDGQVIAFVALALVSACSLLFFRFFITLDGPVHVLQASVLEQHWTTPRYVADGIAYRTDLIDVQIGDLLLMALLHVLSPEGAHDAYAVLLLFLLPLGGVALVRSFGVRPGAAALWLVPVSFGSILILGFFHFLFGVSLSCLLAAFWIGRDRITRRELFLLPLALLLLWCTHRAASFVFVLIVVGAEATLHLTDGDRWKARWALLPGKWPVAVTVVLLALGMGPAISTLLRSGMVSTATDRDPWAGLVTLRALLLIDREGEQWMLIAMGSLMMIAVAAGLYLRRTAMRLVPADVLLLLALACWVASLAFDTPRSLLFYFAERMQWLGLLFLVCWLCALPRSRVIIATAIAALAIHAARLVHVQNGMAGLREAHDRTIEAAHELDEGAVVVPFLCDGNWLLAHLGAYVAVRHNGILFTRKEHLNFALADPPIPAVRRYLKRMSADRKWLTAQLASSQRPVIAQLLFIGGDRLLRAQFADPIASTIETRYWKSFDNGYATVYTLEAERAGRE